MNVMGNISVGDAVEAIGTFGGAMLNNSLGAAGSAAVSLGSAILNNPLAAGAVVLGMAVAAAEGNRDESDFEDDSDSSATDHAARWRQFEDVSDTKAAPPREESTDSGRGAKRQRTSATTSLVTRRIDDAPVAATSSFDEYRRPTATIEAATAFARPRVAPRLRPVIEAGDVEPAILEESRRLQVPLSKQAITAARARVGTNQAAIAKLQFEINELKAEIREAEELEPVFDWACKLRMLAKSRSVKRVSKMDSSLFKRRLM